jgi:hypothetical protein
MSPMAMSPKAERAWLVLLTLYSRRAPAPVLRRAERLFHRMVTAEK